MNLYLKVHTKISLLFAVSAILLLVPALSSAQERIAFSATADNNSDIWSTNTDGTDPKRLTNNSASDIEPSFSADGGKIVFTSFRDGNAEIYVMNADGTDQKRLTTNTVADLNPVWSHDGTKIIFVSRRDSNSDVFSMNADGSNPVNLTLDPDSQDLDDEPAISPDGKTIVFRRIGNGGADIIAMKSDGTDQTPLTSNAGVNAEPVFSPDGSKIVFRSTRDGNSEIYVMDADGSDEVNLTNSTTGEGAPCFSTDGNKIIFGDTRDIFVMDADGSNRMNVITTTAPDERNPSWGASNSAPVVSDVVITSPIAEGSEATLTFKIEDENANDSFTVRVQWNSVITQIFELPAGARNFEFTTRFRDDEPDGTPSDTLPIKVSVDDHRFGKGTGETSVTINNVDPILVDFAVTPSSVVPGQTVKLSGTVEDPGHVSDPSDEELRVTINWGDGKTEIMDLFAPGPIFPPTHQYAIVGTYHVTVQVTDNDMGETVQMFDVSVTPPPPPVAPSDLRVDFIAMNRIQIVWTDKSDNEDGFIIEGCAQRGCNNFIELGRVFPNIRHFVHGNLFANTQYYYRVRAFNQGGMSSYTEVVSAKTLRK